MRDDRYEPYVELELLVLVKAYPTPSQKYSECVCVAGLRLDTATPEWLRLYPVRFRDLPRTRQFKKYDVIRVRARRRTGDPRPESYSPDTDTLQVVDHYGAERAWECRVPIIEAVKVGSLCELQRRQAFDGTSLGVFRPAEITGFECTPTSPEGPGPAGSAWAREPVLPEASTPAREDPVRFPLHIPM